MRCNSLLLNSLCLVGPVVDINVSVDQLWLVCAAQFCFGVLRRGVSGAESELTVSDLLAIDSAWPVRKMFRRTVSRPTAEHTMPQEDLMTLVGET